MQKKDRKPKATLSRDKWFVYMMRCAVGSLYTGITKDVKRRCQQHNAGTAKFLNASSIRSVMACPTASIREGSPAIRRSMSCFVMVPLFVECCNDPYFAGSFPTNFTARSIQSANWSSPSTPSGSTSTQPFIGLPVMSNFLMGGSLIA